MILLNTQVCSQIFFSKIKKKLILREVIRYFNIHFVFKFRNFIRNSSKEKNVSIGSRTNIVKTHFLVNTLFTTAITLIFVITSERLPLDISGTNFHSRRPLYDTVWFSFQTIFSFICVNLLFNDNMKIMVISSSSIIIRDFKTVLK